MHRQWNQIEMGWGPKLFPSKSEGGAKGYCWPSTLSTGGNFPPCPPVPPPMNECPA